MKIKQLFERVSATYPNTDYYRAGLGFYGVTLDWGADCLVVTDADEGEGFDVGRYTQENWEEGKDPKEYLENLTVKEVMETLDRWTSAT